MARLCAMPGGVVENYGKVACIKAFRRAGTGRNRGSGRLTATLRNGQGEDVTDHKFEIFKQEVQT